jgi:transcriptional regulator with XRE-family HTH domain
MDLKSSIGKRIRELRNAKSLTQEEVAWKSELDRTFMNHVENGRRNISIESLEKICSGLEISVKEFFNSDLFNSQKKTK